MTLFLHKNVIVGVKPFFMFLKSWLITINTNLKETNERKSSSIELSCPFYHV